MTEGESLLFVCLLTCLSDKSSCYPVHSNHHYYVDEACGEEEGQRIGARKVTHFVPGPVFGARDMLGPKTLSLP